MEIFKNLKKENIYIFILTLICFFLMTYYVINSTVEVPVSDYVRIINFYINDVCDLKYLLSIESISRVPITFLIRFINVKLFGYSIFFDRIVNILGLSLFNFIICCYVINNIKTNFIKIISPVIISFMSFNLLSWEMILNGTAYPHFIFMFLMAYAFYLYDKNIENFNKRFAIKFCLFISLSSLICGGSYMISFLSTLIFISFINIIYEFYKNVFSTIKNKYLKINFKNILNNKLKYNILIIIFCLFTLILYMISNNSGEVVNPVGFKDVKLKSIIESDIFFAIRFILNAIASSIVGINVIENAKFFNTLNDFGLYIIAFINIFVSIIILIIYFIKKIYKNHILPLMMIIMGSGSFLLIFLARYKFLDESYGMSSRYEIQYIWFIIGIVIICFFMIDDFLYNYKNNISFNLKSKRLYYLKNISNIIIMCFCVFYISFVISGFLITFYQEINLMPYRKAAYQNVKDIALDIDNNVEKDIETIFEYHHGKESIINAIDILKKNNLNIFKSSVNK